VYCERKKIGEPVEIDIHKEKRKRKVYKHTVQTAAMFTGPGCLNPLYFAV